MSVKALGKYCTLNLFQTEMTKFLIISLVFFSLKNNNTYILKKNIRLTSIFHFTPS
jgi:hypothetical protein